MYTSDTGKRALRTAVSYLCIAVLCAVFAFIYELFSHGVYSLCMILCFSPPLLLGALPFFIIYVSRAPFPGRLSYNLYNSGVATLTAGLIFSGVVYIYGTTNTLCRVYYIVAAAFIVCALICFIFDIKKDKKYLKKTETYDILISEPSYAPGLPPGLFFRRYICLCLRIFAGADP